MRAFIFALRDRLANNFRQITMNESEFVEKRNWAYAVNNDKSLSFISKDIELCKIAEIDTRTGVVKPITPIEVICRFDQLVGAEGDVDNEIR